VKGYVNYEKYRLIVAMYQFLTWRYRAGLRLFVTPIDAFLASKRGRYRNLVDVWENRAIRLKQSMEFRYRRRNCRSTRFRCPIPEWDLPSHPCSLANRWSIVKTFQKYVSRLFYLQKGRDAPQMRRTCYYVCFCQVIIRSTTQRISQIKNSILSRSYSWFPPNTLSSDCSHEHVFSGSISHKDRRKSSYGYILGSWVFSALQNRIIWIGQPVLGTEQNKLKRPQVFCPVYVRNSWETSRRMSPSALARPPSIYTKFSSLTI